MESPLERSRSEGSLTSPTALGERSPTTVLQQSPIGTMRGASMHGMGIPAGHSHLLGNRLGLAAYANLSGRYVARLDVPPPCRAPRPNPPDRQRRIEETWLAPERLKPETLPPAGGIVERIRGKQMVQDNTNNLSNVDTLIFGRDVDGSMGCRSMGHSVTYAGRAGLDMRFENTPAWGEVPPVCRRTFGEDPHADGWEQVSYSRKDPRRDYEP